MDHEHYTYPEALRYLANKYNIPIEEERMTEEQKERQTERDGLFHVTEFAQKYFADILHNDEMGQAIGLSYFHQRGLSDEIINTFGLGYCLDEWRNFTDHARRNGYSDEVLEKSGLTIFKEEGKCYDRFRGRVMFPIYSISGRVLGFSGRILSSEKQAAKYVNSPDSEIYDKSHTLYGIYQARNAISKEDKCYLVEGNVDVVSMHQSGVCNTVASCGTSLTVEQIRLIKRFTPNVTVLYDGDKAGIKAALRAVNLLFEEGMHVRVVLFPDGEDPDSYAQKYGSTQLQEYLRTHEENFLAFKTRVLLDDVEQDPIRKSEVLKEIVNTIALVPDRIEQQDYIRLASSKLRMNEQVLLQELGKAINLNLIKSRKEEARQQSQSSTPASATPQQPLPTDGPPPLEPDPDDYELMRQSSSYRSPEQILAAEHPAEAQEKKIVRLLLNYGNKEIPQEVVDDEGNTFVANLPIANIIVDEIVSNELHFDNPLYQQIFDLFRKAVEDEQPLPDANFFATNSDTILRNNALSLMVESYTVSDLWLTEKHISVPSIESRLYKDVEESILVLKQKKIEQKIEALSYKMRECKDEEESLILLAEHSQLVNLRQAVCQQLRRVIV
jgi:DNA primase